MKPTPTWLPYALLGGLLLLFLTLSVTVESPVQDIPYSRFKQLVAEGEVEEVTLRGDQATVRLRSPVPVGPGAQPSLRVSTRIPAFGDPELLPLLEDQAVEVRSLPAESGGLSQLLIALFPWVLLIGIYWFFWRRMSQSFGGMMGRRGVDEFLSGPAKDKGDKAKDGEKPKITFADVAGQDNAKREVSELVEFLRDPTRYTRLGAEPPRGILLVGPPGTGKTLLARALAGESGVPFFHISASEFIEVFVGVGASRVRQLFEEAKKNAHPALSSSTNSIAVGRVRGTGFGGGNDEREQTLEPDSRRAWTGSRATRRPWSSWRRPTGPTCSTRRCCAPGGSTGTSPWNSPTRSREKPSCGCIREKFRSGRTWIWP